MNKRERHLPRSEIQFRGKRVTPVVDGNRDDYVKILQDWQRKYGRGSTFAEILLKEAGLGKAPSKN